MGLQIAILYNHDHGLVAGENQDALATLSVIEAARAVAEACRKNAWDPILYPAPNNPEEFIQALYQSRANLVFNLVEALAGETRLEAAVAWLYELVRIPYTGSPPLTISLCLNKSLAKAVLRDAGLPVPAGYLIHRSDEPIVGLCFPLIVKPAYEDASHGIAVESVVYDEAAARARAQYIISRYQQPALIEEFIEGREFNISILAEGDKAHVLPAGEIDFSDFPEGKPRLVTYAAKWIDESLECKGTKPIPAQLEPTLSEQITRIALAAYRTLGLRDYGRVDLRLHPRNGPVILEVNSNPDISPDAGLARAAARAGMNYDQLIGYIVQLALSRQSNWKAD